MSRRVIESVYCNKLLKLLTYCTQQKIVKLVEQFRATNNLKMHVQAKFNLHSIKQKVLVAMGNLNRRVNVCKKIC